MGAPLRSSRRSLLRAADGLGAVGYKLVADFDGAPELPNLLRRKHWREARDHSRYWRVYLVRVIGQKAPPAPLERARVCIEVWRRRAPDPDNLVASVKPLIDGLQPQRNHTRKGRRYTQHGAGVIADDREGNFEGGKAEVVFHPCPRKERVRVRITVEEV